MLRTYVFEVTTFEGESEHITAEAECRALGFSAAARKATDPCNVCKVKLLRDNGSEIVYVHYTKPPLPIIDPRNRSELARDHSKETDRYYDSTVTMHTLAEASIAASVTGRPNVFSYAAINSQESSHGDGVLEICLSSIMLDEESGLLTYFEMGKKYGGITDDIHDEIAEDQFSFV